VRRALIASFVTFAALFVAGCPKGNQDYRVGRKAEIVGDYDTAVLSFDKALKRDPLNAEYKLHDMRAHFEAGQFHVEQGEKALNEGRLEEALGEFQKAEAIDPSSAIAQQEAQKAEDLLAKMKQQEAPKPVGMEEPEDLDLMSAPPKLKPLSQNAINLKMGPSDARVVFNTIGQLAGLSVIFDPSFVSRSINVDLPNVTLEQALDAVSLSAGAFWKPVTSNIILVATDNLQTRRNLEDEEVQTFYLRNATTPQEVSETATLLRTLLDLTHEAQLADQNAIVVRATPDKLMLASKIIDSIDKPKPEVVLQVDVLEARVDHERNLGIQPGQSATLAFTPRTSIQPNGGTNNNGTGTGTGTSSNTNNTPQVTLNNLHHLSTGDYSVTLPGATLNALLNDSTTRIIQDPSIRIIDGSTAKLKIGDRVPIATGSFQAGVGVGVSGGAGLVNPLVNTQFTYEDVGVNLEITPRVHPDGDVSMKLDVDVSSVTGQSNIGGIQQPIISQRHLGPDEIRMKDGEVSILGGLITRSDVKSLSGWPGLARIPFLRYFFSSEDKTSEDDEVLIALTPHVVRMPSITAEDLRTLASGSDANVRVYEQNVEQAGAQTAAPSAAAPSSGANANSQNQAPTAGAATLSFQPENISLKTGGTTTVNLLVNNVHDLFSIPLLLQYNPAVIQVDDIKNGGFLSGGTQEIAIVHQENPQQGQAVVSATRKPNTPGISGTGTIIGIVIRAIGPGTSPLQVLQVNARDSQQKPIALTSGTATIQVQ